MYYIMYAGILSSYHEVFHKNTKMAYFTPRMNSTPFLNFVQKCEILSAMDMTKGYFRLIILVLV